MVPLIRELQTELPTDFVLSLHRLRGINFLNQIPAGRRISVIAPILANFLANFCELLLGSGSHRRAAPVFLISVACVLLRVTPGERRTVN
jgi:hypothetical protein